MLKEDPPRQLPLELIMDLSIRFLAPGTFFAPKEDLLDLPCHIIDFRAFQCQSRSKCT